MTSEVRAHAQFTLGEGNPPTASAPHTRVTSGGFETTFPGTGIRYDESKNRLDLIPPEWVLALGEVLTKGAAKYAPRNWENGMAHSKMVGCALRHLYAYLRGERYDRETGCHHLAHCAWNVLALMTYDVRDLGDNDLPRLGFSPTMIER